MEMKTPMNADIPRSCPLCYLRFSNSRFKVCL